MVSRRDFLKQLAGVTGATAVVAACSTGNEKNTEASQAAAAQAPELSREEVMAKELYTSLRMQVDAHLEKAAAENKTPVFLLAENHSSNASMLAGLMLQKILTEKFASFHMENAPSQMHTYKENLIANGLREAFNQHGLAMKLYAEYSGRQILGCENLPIAQEIMQNFQAGFVRTTQAQYEQVLNDSKQSPTRPTVIHQGANHTAALLELLSDKDRAKLHVLPLDITNRSLNNGPFAHVAKQVQDAIVPVEIGRVFDELPQEQVIQIAAKVTGDASLDRVASTISGLHQPQVPQQQR